MPAVRECVLLVDSTLLTLDIEDNVLMVRKDEVEETVI